MGLLTFPFGVLLSVAIYAAIGVFWLGQVEHVWGPWGSFQVMVVIGLVAGVFATVPYGVAASIMHRYPSAWLSLLLGGLVAAAALLTAWLVSKAGLSPSLAGLALFGLSALAPLACRAKSMSHPPKVCAT
jgi:hypothetical protein